MLQKKVRILLVGSVPPPYHGSNVYFDSLLKKISNDLIEQLFFSTNDDREDNLNIGKIDYKNIVQGLKNLYCFLIICIKKKPDIIYINTTQSYVYVREGLFILISHYFTSAKIVEHLHGSLFNALYEKSNFFFKKFIDFTQRKVDSAIVLGESLKFNFQRWIEEKNIFVVPNGIDIKYDFKSKENNSEVKLYYLGSIKIFKGIIICLEVLVKLMNLYPFIKLHIIGEYGNDSIYGLSASEVENKVSAFIEKNDIKNNVVFYGLIKDKKKFELISDMDIHLHPTINDGMPLVILESMAVGNIVISSKNIGAISEVIIDGESGFLVEGNDSLKITEYVKELINNPDKREAMRRNSYNRFYNEYTLDINISRIRNTFIKVYHGVQ